MHVDPAVENLARPCRSARLIWIGVALAIIVVGFAGVDRWFYEQVSLRLNDETRPVGRDFHALTRPFWETVRLVTASIWAAVVLAVVGAVLDPRRTARYLLALAAVGVVGLAANVLQGAIGRLRPNQAESHLAFKPPLTELLSKETVCFPSGEATLAFAIAATATSFLPRWRWAFFAAATLGALARLVNGAHYPSDVAAGALLGALAAPWLLQRLTPLERYAVRRGPA